MSVLLLASVLDSLSQFLITYFHLTSSFFPGYAKEMSAEWFAAADAMLLNECKNFDVIITTALIPGKKAPVLIKKNMVSCCICIFYCMMVESMAELFSTISALFHLLEVSTDSYFFLFPFSG